MNHKNLITLVLSAFAHAFIACSVSADETAPSTDSVQLSQSFDFAAPRSPETQHYKMETTIVAFSPNGEISGQDTYRMLLKCVPGNQSGRNFDLYTCSEFSLKQGDQEAASIPALDGWTHEFRSSEGIDEEGQVFGIDHGIFEGLSDSNGAALAPDKAYHVYNTFIDFHAFCNVFAEPTHEGNGIQHLAKIGERIVHDSAFSEPPVKLGSNVADGSTFKNGEISLELKGVSLLDHSPCALVGFDSGQSLFRMFLEPIPGIQISTRGGSHYRGILYIDLSTMWVRKVEMSELVVSETTLPMPPNEVRAVHERSSVIRWIDATEFADSKK